MVNYKLTKFFSHQYMQAYPPQGQWFIIPLVYQNNSDLSYSLHGMNNNENCTSLQNP